MRSSTSSSDDRLPRGGWGRTWRLTLLGLVILLGGLELTWRIKGYYAQVYGADESWILSFAQLSHATSVALGTSRIQAALDPQAWQSVMGGKPPIDLALPGNAPLPILDYIADSTDYRGTVLVEVLPLDAFDARQQGAPRGRGLLDRYDRDRVSPASMSEAWLQVHLLRFFVFRSPELLPSEFFKRLGTGELMPDKGLLHLRTDRFGPIQQKKFIATNKWDPQRGFYEIGHAGAEHEGRVPTPEEFDALRGRYYRIARVIQGRGGRVVFLHLAGCGERGAIEARRYPRATFWDPFARQSPALALATEDFPELQHFACYDGSHIDATDAAAYSRALATVVKAQLQASGGTR
ncbi:MAG TPA: hypothetical protein VGI92_09445 [Gemmatimonadales bacterium]